MNAQFNLRSKFCHKFVIKIINFASLEQLLIKNDFADMECDELENDRPNSVDVRPLEWRCITAVEPRTLFF